MQRSEFLKIIFDDITYTLIVTQGKDGFLIGQLKELPEVFTQGLTISELKENIADVIELYFEDMRESGGDIQYPQ